MDQVYFLEVETPVESCIFNTLLSSVPDEKRERLLRYRYAIDRELGLFSDILIRCLLCRRTGARFQDINIKVGETGKPYLSGIPGHEFNVSHTRNAIAAIFSGRPVGIDIERIRNIDIGIAQEIFTVKERAWLNEIPKDRYTHFFSLWTKKEAYAKYTGMGLSMNLKSFDVLRGFPSVQIGTMIVNDYVISVCSETGFDENTLIRITEAELIKMWRIMHV